ncbi:hypothetical protein APW67_10540 [Staphylococcus aureus]|nr:hypothetical protein APW67_10540 [Staphylococcus aureus]
MKRIAVYCGASKGHDPSYVQKAYDLGKYFAEQGYELVFGAGSIGIMGAIQDGVLNNLSKYHLLKRQVRYYINLRK